MTVHFSDYFHVSNEVLDGYGAFNVSLIADLPLFIDPFLLFNSKQATYRQLHDGMIRYLRFLKDRSVGQTVTAGLLQAWYRFPEVKQTWLGFSDQSNRGRGLGREFATALNKNLHQIFKDFGSERITRGSHLEKLCLIKDGVGRDNISDFTTNLIKAFLLDYTQVFALKYIPKDLRKVIMVGKVRFNYETETWESAKFELPWHQGDFVILTPKDILTKDDTWINKTDLVDDFEAIPEAIPNIELRAQINNYFLQRLPEEPKKKDLSQAAAATIMEFPQLIDYYIRYKEEHGERAANVSAEKVRFSEKLFVKQIREFVDLLAQATTFYRVAGGTYEEAHERVAFLRDVIENKGGHRLFYVNREPIQREKDLHILCRLTWYGTPSDVSTEADDGRGPVDFKISRGARDKTLVEFKLAKNNQLKRNLERQVGVYEKASDAKRSIKVIVYFTAEELERVNKILRELGLAGHRDVVLIDARKDNKPSGSRA